MQTNVRLRLDMGGRAAEFCRTHPDPDPAAAQVASRLFDLNTRAEALALQQRTGQVVASAAVIDKADLRVVIEDDLGALIGIAKIAAKEHPDLAVHRRMPSPKTNEATFLTIVRVAVSEARAAFDLLAPFGLTDQLLESLASGIEAYEAALVRQRNALTSQVGAGAELTVIASDIVAVVKNLDALYRVRFRKDPELMAAWKSARNVAWPNPATPPAPGSTDPGVAA